MKKYILTIISFITLGCEASPDYSVAVKNCLDAQLEIGNEYLGLDSKPGVLVNTVVRKYESEIYILSVANLDQTVSNAGPISVCHMVGNKVGVAFFEYGEFGLYGKNKRVYIESPSLSVNDIETETFELQCAVSTEKTVNVDCSTKQPSPP